MENTIKQWRAEKPEGSYRPLSAEEAARLKGQLNTASDWSGVRVAEGFDAGRVHRCSFDGQVLIGAFTKGGGDAPDGDCLRHGHAVLKTGLYGSHFRDTSIGDNPAIHNLLYCSGQDIGDSVIISNVGEISSGEGASFGMSVNDGRRYPIEVINENGGRAILPYPGMTCTDAYVWAKFRDDKELMAKLSELTYAASRDLCPKRAVIGDSAAILNAKAVRESLVGPSAVIDGADIVYNSTILSDAGEKTFIGPAVHIENAIIGYGNRVDSAAQLSCVMTGTAASLSKAARVTHSVIGDNAQIACCEVANCLIMPSHAQHHNNSFLIAAALGGQSNVAAGSTIGSNHNSRVNDGEIWAQRGFWPGLCVSLRHNSRFASFTMIAKGAYQTELDLRLPFSLVALDEKNGSVAIFPAFWFTQNMYAVMRSSQKFAARDKRVHKGQFIEHDILAPDTVDEIFDALQMIEAFGAAGSDAPKTPLRRADEGAKMYRMMVRHYCAKNILPYMRKNGLSSYSELINAVGLSNDDRDNEKWVNCGALAITESALASIINAIKSPKIKAWPGVHALFDAFLASYSLRKVKHSIRSLAKLENTAVKGFNADAFEAFLEFVPEDSKKIAAYAILSRTKDYKNPFRKAVYRSLEEMVSVLGPVEDAVITKTTAETDELAEMATALLNNGVGSAVIQ
ncbi:MAG: DUF4954 family protein [Chitinispirillales bacterium]|jgi:hypothetical protein|nr:DUF4954 family protein [Chitinispirillales bacterium]